MEQTIIDLWASISTHITLYGGKIILALLLLVVGWWIISRIANLVATRAQTSIPDETLAKFLASSFEVILKALLPAFLV